MKYKLEVQQGATFKLDIVRESSEGEPDINMEGAEVYMHFRKTYSSQTTEAEASTEDGRITVSGNRISIRIPATDTAKMKAASGVYDIEIQYSPDDVERILEGTYKLSLEVTRI